MKTLGLAALFMTDSMLAPLIALSGLFLIIGLRRLAVSLFVLVLATAISPIFEPLFDELFAAMPWWFPIAFFIGIVFLFAGRFIRDVLVHVLGELIASFITFVFTSPRLLASLLLSGAVLWAWFR